MLWKLLRAVFKPRANSVVERALALRQLGRLSDAEQVLREAVEKFPRDPVVLTNLALALIEQDKQEGVPLLLRALECDPEFASAHYNLAHVLRSSGRLDEAIAHYTAANRADFTIAPACEELMHALLEVCDWDRAQVEADKLRARVAGSSATEWMPCVSTSTAAYLGLDLASRKQVARYHAEEFARAARPIRRGPRSKDEPGRIRIGYLSRDFRDHPVGHLMRGAFALHDRARFEAYAFSYGPDDGSVYRKSIAAGADHFVDFSAKTDEQAAAEISAAGIDILIDLAGHTTGNRLAILARRPAPVQVHYLGYPRTTGAAYLDYFITDHVATPPECAAEFTEQLAYLPRCYMVSNGLDAEQSGNGTRADHGLPENAFVFCNFATSSRITRGVFEMWMEILRALPSGVLWLKNSHALTEKNLRNEAQRCGIDPDRLVFAQRVGSKVVHMARLGLADLALDTIGWYNGHTSTSDMLWAGVPVLTVPGDTFASRVAASLVTAAGIPELSVRNIQEYAETAIRLGNDRAQLGALTRKLADNKCTAPFFDTRQIVRDLEAAYSAMWDTYRAGHSARTIDLATQSP